MKNFFLFFILFSNYFFAQQKIEWGALLKNSVGKSEHMWIAAQDSENIYVIKRRYFMTNTTWFLESINRKNKTLNFLRALVAPKDAAGKSTKIRDVVYFGNTIYLLSEGFSRSEKKLSLYATVINKATGLRESTQEVYAVKAETESVRINATFSDDDLNVLVYAYNSYHEEEMKLMDSEFSTLWQGKVNFVPGDSVGKKLDPTLDNFGNIIFRSENQRTITLFSTKRNSKRNIRITIPKETYNYSSLIRIAPNNDAYFLIMLKSNKYDVTCGYMHTFINLETQEIVLSKTVLFNDAQIKEVLGKNIGSQWHEIGSYYIKDVLFRENDMVLIGEQGYIERVYQPNYYRGYIRAVRSGLTSGYNPVGNIPVITEYHSNLISVFDLTFSGEIKWIRAIPKNQAHPNYNYLPYIANYNQKGIYLMYNDSPDNVNQKHELGPVRLDNPKKGVGVLAFVDNNGQLSVSEVYNKRQNYGLTLKPGLSLPAKNSFVLFAENKDEFKIGEFFLP